MKAKSVIGIILCVKSFVFIFPRNIWIKLGYLKDSNAAAHSVDTGIS